MIKASTSNFEKHTVSRSEMVSLLTHFYWYSCREINWQFVENVWQKYFPRKQNINFCGLLLSLLRLSPWAVQDVFFVVGSFTELPLSSMCSHSFKRMANTEVPEVSFSFCDTESLKHNSGYFPMDNVWRQKNYDKTREWLGECFKY